MGHPDVRGAEVEGLDGDDARLLSHPGVRRVVRWGVVAWSLIGVGYLVLIVYRYVLYPVRVVFPPLLLALAIVYLLNPLVSMMERRGVGRVWGALLTYVLFLGVVVVGLRLLVPILADQITGFAKSVPALLDRAQESFADLNRRLRLDVDTSSLFRSLGPEGVGGAFISRIFSFTAGVFHVAVAIILGAVFGFYLLVDMPKMQRSVMALIPARRRPGLVSVLDKMGRALGGYFRGQLLVAVFVGLASMLGLFIVGLPYWALVGLVAGLFNLIPLIGPFIGAIPAVFIAITAEESSGLLGLEPGWPLAFGASLALLTVQQIDNHIVSPNVVARTVRIHPITVMLGLLVGGTLLGLWGMLLAVPVIAAIKILVLYFWDTRLQWPPRTEPVERSGPGPPSTAPPAAPEAEPGSGQAVPTPATPVTSAR